MTWSASSRNRSATSIGPTGTARTTRAAPWALAMRQAARAVAPVATPSSTTRAVLPSRDVRGRPARNRAARSSTTASSRRSTDAISASLTWASRTTSGLSTSTPSSPTAPIASSGWKGTPSLRTTITSKGASSAEATSKATGTPPRGRPRTTVSGPRRCSTLRASWRPASARFANMAHLRQSLLLLLTLGADPDLGQGRWSRLPAQGHRLHGQVVKAPLVTVEHQRRYDEADQERPQQGVEQGDRLAVHPDDDHPDQQLAEGAAEEGGQERRLDQEDQYRTDAHPALLSHGGAEPLVAEEQRGNEPAGRPVEEKRRDPATPSRDRARAGPRQAESLSGIARSFGCCGGRRLAHSLNATGRTRVLFPRWTDPRCDPKPRLLH